MIEKFTNEEIAELLSDLEEYGYIKGAKVEHVLKSTVLRNELDALGCKYIRSEAMRGHIFAIVDEVTNNYEKAEGGYKRKRLQYIKDENVEEYTRVIKGIVKAIQPYYIKTGGVK